MEPLLPTLQQTLDIWRAMRLGPAYPKRADFDPLNFRAVLGRLSLLQIYRDPLRFNIAFTGPNRRALWDLT